MMDQQLMFILMIVSVSVLLTNMTVELIKELPILKPIPTNIVVLLTSQLFVNLGIYAYLDHRAFPVLWYYIPSIIMIGFIVAYLAMYGWEKFIKLWEQSKYPKG